MRNKPVARHGIGRRMVRALSLMVLAALVLSSCGSTPTVSGQTMSNERARAEFAAVEALATRLYLFSFQSSTVSAIDPLSGHVLHQVLVTGDQPGVAVAPDGKQLYIVDGPSDGQLRVLDSSTWQVIHQQPIKDRALLLGANPTSLSGDGRWLLVEHYSYEREQAWISLFDARMKRFVSFPEGSGALPLDQCPRPARLAGQPGHAQLYIACGGLVAALDAATLQVLWQVPVPDGDHIELVVAPGGELVYGMRPQVDVSYEFPDGHGRVTGTDLRLFTWEAATGKLAHDSMLSDQAAVPTATFGRGDTGYFSIAPDGARLYVAWEDRLWTLEPATLQVTGELPLPAPVDGMALSLDGSELYFLPATAGDLKVRRYGLWTVDTTSLKLVRQASGWPQMVVPFVLSAPAPDRSPAWKSR